MAYKGQLAETTPPTVEPVTRAEVQTHLRLDTTDSSEDSLLDQLIATARRQAENYCDRSFTNTTWTWYLETFEDELIFPFGSATVVNSVKYLDADAAEQTLASSVYQTDFVHRLGRILLDDAQQWPNVHAVKANPIYIEYVAGYGATAAHVPEGVKDALLRMIGTLYEVREDCNIDSLHMRTSRALLDGFRLRYNT